MKTIHNTTQAPLRVSLGLGKVLHLGPGQAGQIADDALQSRGVRKLIDSGEIAVMGAEGRAGAFDEAQGSPRESAHGHAHGGKVFPSGNRGG